MSQLSFEALTGGGLSNIDNQTVLAAFLESHSSLPNDTDPSGLDDEDVFLCGKCKKQFTSLHQFMIHKKEHCNALTNASVSSLVNNGVVVKSISNVGSSPMIAFMSSNQSANVQTQLQAPTSPLENLNGGNILLTEAELLALTANLEHLTSCQQNDQSENNLGSNPENDKDLSDLENISNCINNDSNATSHSSAMNLSILSNALANGSLLVSNHSNTDEDSISHNASNLMRNMVVTISQPSLDKLHEEMMFTAMEEEVENSGSVDEPSHAGGLAPTKNSQTINCDPIEAIEPVTAPTSVGLQIEVKSEMEKPSKLRCTYCDKVFNKNFDLQQHIRCHTGEKPFQCVVCGRPFAQKSNVKKHLQTHKVWPDGLANTLPRPPAGHAKDDSSNSENNSQSSNQETVTMNEGEGSSKNVGISNVYMCPYCKFSGKTYSTLKSHMTQHKVEKLYKCILFKCGKLFGELDSFLEHIKTHENEMTYQCHICFKEFSSLYDLGAHQHAHSLYPNQGRPRNGPKSFRCTRCLNKYSTEAALHHHMNTSTHNYECPHCEKEFTCERYLRRHLNTHNSQNTHICVVCGKGFKTENYLRIHYTTHSTEKPFKCTSCDAAFNRRDKLKRHMLVHDPVKKLKCPFRNYTGCEREFNRPDKLKAHILTHSDIKPFKCALCPRAFARKTLLNSHAAQRHSDRIFRCLKCAHYADDAESLAQHVCSPSLLKRARANNRFLRTNRNKKLKLKSSSNAGTNQVPRKIGRPKKDKTVINGELPILLNDGIPTAHIEIISTENSVSPQKALSQLKMTSYPMVQIVENSRPGSLQLIKNMSNTSVIHVIDDRQLSSLSLVNGNGLIDHNTILRNIGAPTAGTTLSGHEAVLRRLEKSGSTS